MRFIIDRSFADFSAKVKTKKKQIVCLGAGLVALSLEDIFVQSDICGNICFFVDGDTKKHGTTLAVGGRDVAVESVDFLLASDLHDKILVITCEDFNSIIEILEKYDELRHMECYLFPELNRSYISGLPDELCEQTGISIIPKTLHYCWFGGGEMSEFERECLSSWKKYNPDYEVVLWNEDNYDVFKNSYMRQAYQKCKFAFVSDFARLDVLYQHGGIYLDTDVTVMKNLDSLLMNKAFIAYGEWPVVNSGSGLGTIEGLEIIRQMRDEPRSRINFINSDGGFNLSTNSCYETKILRQHGFKMNFTYQRVQDIAIYPPCYFPSCGLSGVNAAIGEKAYAVHNCRGSWKGAVSV